MRATTMCLLALCIVGSALGVTQTFYTDNTCKTKAPSPFLDISNPWIARTNTCTKYLTVAGQPSYSKITACSSTSVSYIYCSSPDCSANCFPSTTEAVGKCLTVSGTNYIITCDPASTVSLALLAVAAAVVVAVL